MMYIFKINQGLKLISIIALLILVGCKSELYNDLSQKEANEMSAILSQYKISVKRQRAPDGLYTLMVEDKHFAKSVEILSRLGYPKETYKSFDELFSENKLVPSPLEERSRLSHAIGQELSHTLTSIDDILRARVHVVLPEVTPLGKSVGEPTASVIVTYADHADPERLLPSIKNIISSSVKGLAREDVSVSFHKPQAMRFSEDVLSPPEQTSSSILVNIAAIFSVLALLFFSVVMVSRIIRSRRGQVPQPENIMLRDNRRFQ